MTRIVSLARATPGLLAALAAGSALAADAPTKLAEVSGDLNADGVADRAVLLREADGDDVDLAVYLSTAGQAATQPTVYVKALGWAGDMDGTAPEISISHTGSLIVVFQNDSIGRDRWRQQLTIAFRHGELVVAGYGYQTRDTLNPRHATHCDLNLLSGHGVVNAKPVKLDAAAPRLTEWSQKSLPETCRSE
jgi:hypothetical protein